MNDDDDWPAEPFLGVGSAHSVSERGIKKPNKNPIGFVHFPDKPERKARRVKAAKPKLKARRKR